MLEHIDRAIHEDGHRTRELLRQFMIHTERKLEAMTIDSKQILAELRAERTQVSGVILLCNTLKQHLVTVIAKLNQMPSVDPAVAQDLQDMHDLLAQNTGDIARAVTDDADVPDAPDAPDAPPPVEAPPDAPPPAPVEDPAIT